MRKNIYHSLDKQSCPSLKRYIFKADLKLSIVWHWQMEMGKVFHSFRPATEKALSPYFCFPMISMRRSCDEDRSALDGTYC